MPSSRARAMGSLLCILVLLCSGATAVAGTPPAPFAPDGVWNRPLAAGAPIAADSERLVGELVRQVRTYGSWVNTTRYSTPVYRVDAAQPGVRVTLDAPDSAVNRRLADALASVPLPPGARPAAGDDGHAVVWRPATDEMWELWRLRELADGWHASWGGKIDGVSTNPGVHPWPYGATATGLALHGGLILPSEVQAGDIPHALAISVPELTASVFAAPANRTDGTIAGGGIPAGTRFRLPPTLDIRSLRLPWTAAVMAQAAQRYGLVVRDKGGAVSFYGEDPKSLGSNPWPLLFEGRYPDQNGMLARFPWDKLQVVAP
ncbi:MAG TPA: hypothetical protein VFR97_09135 [Capillimicrobium sp.]|nr:hypothetical protein [Capillimicrobium sp.]